MFHPGETICHQFIIPFMIDEVLKVIITYKQDDHIVLVKTITSGFEQEEKQTKITTTLSQEEALLFDERKYYFIQLNVYTKSGTRCTSEEIRQVNGVQHYKEVIKHE